MNAQRNNFHEVPFENDNVIMREQFLCHIWLLFATKAEFHRKMLPLFLIYSFNSSVLSVFALFFFFLTFLVGKCAIENKISIFDSALS